MHLKKNLEKPRQDLKITLSGLGFININISISINININKNININININIFRKWDDLLFR